MEVVLPHIVADNEYQRNSSVLLTFVPNNVFEQLITASPYSPIFLTAFNQ